MPTVPISSLRRGPGTLGLKSRLSAGLTLGFPERDTLDDRMPRDCPGSKAALDLAFRGDLGGKDLGGCAVIRGQSGAGAENEIVSSVTNPPPSSLKANPYGDF